MTVSPLKWVGGKYASADRIVDSFPNPKSYDTYVEPCGGAAHVLMAKPPMGHHEIYNDLDNNLMTFWSEMQLNAPVIQERLDNHLYSRKVYYDYYRSLFDGTPLPSLERATRWFYVLRATGTGWMRRSPVGWNGSKISSVHAFRSAIEIFADVQQRLHNVCIDNRDVLATVRRYDSSKTLHYIDPPYFGVEQYYEVSKKGFPHEELATLLNTVKGYVALSYYPDPRIDAWYPLDKWRRVTWKLYKHSQMQLAPRDEDIATEMLLLNYPAPAIASLWDVEAS